MNTVDKMTRSRTLTTARKMTAQIEQWTGSNDVKGSFSSDFYFTPHLR